VSAARAQLRPACGWVGGPVDDRVATPLCVLGPLEVVRDDEPVRLGSPQQRRLLAVLVVHANEVVSSDRLVDVLWGEHPPRSATHSLQTLLSRLRATLGDERLEPRPPGYRLRVASGEVDVLRFEELVRVGLESSERPEVALGVFDEALRLANKALSGALETIDVEEARPKLEALAAELLAERDRAVQRGSVDREWIQKTVRWMVEWVPDSDLTLIAAIGRIARLTPTAVS